MDKQQIMMLVTGLLVAVGFMFGIVVNLSSLTPSSGQSQTDSGQREEFNAELPENQYSEEDYGLSANEQINLAVNNQVVFVTAIYEDDPSIYDGLEGIEEEFGDRVYFSKANSSETDIGSDLQVSDYPELVVVGDQPSEQQAFTVETPENDRESVKNAICNAMREPGDQAATCY